MKKFILSLALLACITALQPSPAFAWVIDECPYTGTQAWKCDAMPGYAVPTNGWSPSDIWSVLYRTYWMW